MLGAMRGFFEEKKRDGLDSLKMTILVLVLLPSNALSLWRKKELGKKEKKTLLICSVCVRGIRGNMIFGSENV